MCQNSTDSHKGFLMHLWLLLSFTPDDGPGSVPSRPNSDNRSSVMERTPAAPQSAVPASSTRRPSSLFSKPEETRDESPCSWRLGLRKTGSQNVLSEAAGAREALRDRGASVHRSASSPRISALMDNREKVRCPSVAVQPRGHMETVSGA